jgi:cytochrome b561
MKLLSKYLCALLVAANASIAQAETRWEFNPSESTLEFVVDIAGSQTLGMFANWSAEIIFDPDALADASVTVDVDIASVMIANSQAASLIETGQWLDTEAHSEARLVGLGFNAGQNGTLVLPSMLTLKGVDVPVDLIGTIEIEDTAAFAVFTTSLSREIFAIGDDTPAVADLVTVTATVTANRIDE